MAKSKSVNASTSLDDGSQIPAGTPSDLTLESVEAGAPASDAESFAPVVAAEIAAPEPAAEIVDIVSTPLAIVEAAVETATEGFAASISFDSSLWSKKSLEVWSENASAFFDHAGQVAKAQTLEEVVDLQSRFAKERVEAFIRQSKELFEFAKSLATLTAAPLYEIKKAA